ncbi:hypothetical protein K4G61_g5461, partial [Candida parapsilosis]
GAGEAAPQGEGAGEAAPQDESEAAKAQASSSVSETSNETQTIAAVNAGAKSFGLSMSMMSTIVAFAALLM